MEVARSSASAATATILICDRYLASSVAYGEAQGLDPAWLLEIQRYLPQPDLTFLLDIAPEVSARRKTADRDNYERDLALLGRGQEQLPAAGRERRLGASQRRSRPVAGCDGCLGGRRTTL